MSPRVAALWRHPIKSHGRETLQSVTLTAGQTMPWDRRWAVAHEASKADGSRWVPCANFSRGAKAPGLMAITATSDETLNTVTLNHPKLGEFTFDPDKQRLGFLDWIRPIMPADRMQSGKIIRVDGVGMTDTDFPSISLLNTASNDTLAEQMKTDLSLDRWRGNIIMEGLEPWAEKAWIGKTVKIGGAELEIREEITRCLATTANPKTGIRDEDTLGALNDLGHQEFGVYGVVTKTGKISVGDKIEVS